MSENYVTKSIRNGAVRSLTICGVLCPVPKIVRGNPDILSHVVSMIGAQSASYSHPRGNSLPTTKDLASEWSQIHNEDPTTLRAAQSGAAVCALCPEQCYYRYESHLGEVIQEGKVKS